MPRTAHRTRRPKGRYQRARLTGTPLNGGGVTADDANVVAGDANTDTLTYTLGGADAASFDIGSVGAGSEGQITVGTGTKLDYETKQTYMVTVIATDSFGVSASINVTINVTDQNEGPKISVGGLAIAGLGGVELRRERDSDMVATYSATGPESASARWSLEGDERRGLQNRQQQRCAHLQ